LNLVQTQTPLKESKSQGTKQKEILNFSLKKVNLGGEALVRIGHQRVRGVCFSINNAFFGFLELATCTHFMSSEGDYDHK